MNNPFEELKTDLSEIKKMLKERQEPEDFLTTDQVAQLLKVDRTTVYDLRDAGKLKAYALGKRDRYKRSEVLDSLKQVSGRAA